MNRLRLIFVFIMLVTLGGCNTMEGLGKDIQSAGDKIEDAAK